MRRPIPCTLSSLDSPMPLCNRGDKPHVAIVSVGRSAMAFFLWLWVESRQRIRSACSSRMLFLPQATIFVVAANAVRRRRRPERNRHLFNFTARLALHIRVLGDVHSLRLGLHHQLFLQVLVADLGRLPAVPPRFKLYRRPYRKRFLVFFLLSRRLFLHMWTFFRPLFFHQ